jgi:hypothetical protein
MITLFIALGALVAGVVGAAVLDPEPHQLSDSVASHQPPVSGP